VQHRVVSDRPPSLSTQDGFTIVEVLMAALVLAAGIIGMIGAFDSGRRLTLLSERRTVMAHRAQLEIERLQTNPYGQLAMIKAPTHSAEKGNPDYYVNYNSVLKCSTANCFAWDAEKTGEEESLVLAPKEVECASTSEKECGVASASPTGRKCSEKVAACEWSDGLIEGKVYDFVTWHSDGKCGEKCPAKENYKRLTVIVTAKVPTGSREPAAVRVSTFVSEPS
jgi:Tfp pilus assembly protein PilV